MDELKEAGPFKNREEYIEYERLSREVHSFIQTLVLLGFNCEPAVIRNDQYFKDQALTNMTQIHKYVRRLMGK
jgi:hypothetical protein